MIRSIVPLLLASSLIAACSQGSSTQQGATPGAEPQGAATATPAPTATGAQPAPGTQPSSTGAQASAGQAAAAVPTSTPAASAAPPAEPKFREVTVPEGTSLSVSLTAPIASDSSKIEDPVRGTLAKPLVVSGVTVVPAGAEVMGTVIEATPSARVKGRAAIAFRFDRLRVREETHTIQTARIRREAPGTKAKDAKKIGIGAGVGAIVGGVVDGASGAAIGAAVGGGAGTGVVLATRGSEVQLPAGATVTTRLQKPMTVLVPNQ